MNLKIINAIFIKYTTPSQINLSDTLKKLYVYLYDF